MHHTKTAITWVHDDTNRNYINLKPPGPYKFDKLIFFATKNSFDYIAKQPSLIMPKFMIQFSLQLSLHNP
jgi:hypothetical protein